MYQRNPQVEEAPLQAELMLYNPTSAQFYMLNPTMAHIWRTCETAQPIESLIDSVVEGFEGAERSAVETDVRNAVGELTNLGLLIDTAPSAV
jgi:hypothetical protein